MNELCTVLKAKPVDGVFELLQTCVYFSDESNRVDNSMPDAERAMLNMDVEGTFVQSPRSYVEQMKLLNRRMPNPIDSDAHDNQKIQNAAYCEQVIMVCKNLLSINE